MRSAKTSICLIFITYLISLIVGAVCRKPFIDILVSPIIENGITNKLELIWNIEDFSPGSMVRLWTFTFILLNVATEFWVLKVWKYCGWILRNDVYLRIGTRTICIDTTILVYICNRRRNVYLKYIKWHHCDACRKAQYLLSETRGLRKLV